MDWERFNELVALSQGGRSEEAIQGLRNLVGPSEQAEDNASVLLIIGACQKELGRHDEARETLADARSLAGAHSWVQPRALFFCASMDISEGNWMQAVKTLNTLEEQFPAFLQEPENRDLFEEVRRSRGMVIYELGQPAKALPLLEEAVAVDYERPTALYYLARCRYDLGNLEGAKQAFRDALGSDLHPVYQPSAHYMLGLIHYHQGQHAWAIREYEWCLEHDHAQREPRAKVLTGLVLAYRALGMESEAQRYSNMLDAG